VILEGFECYGKKIYRLIDEFVEKQHRFKGVNFNATRKELNNDLEGAALIDKCFDFLKNNEEGEIGFINFVRKLDSQTIKVTPQKKILKQTYVLEKIEEEFEEFIFLHNRQKLNE
jgi:hypothetical protein